MRWRLTFKLIVRTKYDRQFCELIPVWTYE